MSIEENKVLIRRYTEEIINNQNYDALGEFCAPDVVWHNRPPGVGDGIEGLKAYFKASEAGVSDVESTIEEMIAEGDKVVERHTTRFTHTGELFGVAATGKRLEAEAVVIYRIAEGRIVETWQFADRLALMQELGAVPSPGQARE